MSSPNKCLLSYILQFDQENNLIITAATQGVKAVFCKSITFDFSTTDSDSMDMVIDSDQWQVTKTQQGRFVAKPKTNRARLISKNLVFKVTGIQLSQARSNTLQIEENSAHHDKWYTQRDQSIYLSENKVPAKKSPNIITKKPQATVTVQGICLLLYTLQFDQENNLIITASTQGVKAVFCKSITFDFSTTDSDSMDMVIDSDQWQVTKTQQGCFVAKPKTNKARLISENLVFKVTGVQFSQVKDSVLKVQESSSHHDKWYEPRSGSVTMNGRSPSHGSKSNPSKKKKKILPKTDYLFVPIELKAMVVNDETRYGEHFERWEMNYDNLASYESPVPGPFNTNTACNWRNHPRANGVYLHWTLPAGLRKGKQDRTQNKTVFPFVPNRWLVLRYSGPVAKRKAVAWIVESDYLGFEQGTSDFLEPFASKATRTLIGRKIDLDVWKEEGGKKPFLTAIGAGDITFTAYQPYVENVFSIHDPLLDQDETKRKIVADQDTLSYMVMGWYADPSSDILNSTPYFQDLLRSLDWKVTKDKIRAIYSIYHGLQYHIQWDKKGSIPISKKPADSNNVKVAIGNTSIDAFTALIDHQSTTQGETLNTKLLEAFQYNLLTKLDEPNGEELLEQAIHKAWFSDLPGGYKYVIAKKTVETDSQKHEIPSDWEDPNLQPAWLAQLNLDQQNYEKEFRVLQALQQQLYEFWWTKGQFDQLEPWKLSGKALLQKLDSRFTDENFQKQLNPATGNTLANRVQEQQNKAQNLLEKIPHGTTQKALQKSIQQYAQNKGLPESYILKRVNKTSFHEANNPVVLIAGAGASEPLTQDQPLICRFSDQLITGFTYDGMEIDKSIMEDSIPMVSLSQLPACTRMLIEEFFFLDPYNATTIAIKALATFDSSIIQEVHQALQKRTAMIGQLPDVDLTEWQQPWKPLFLQWEVFYYPIEHDTDGQKNWHFDGRRYSWNGNLKSVQDHFTFTGRIFLTKQSSFIFKRRLDEYRKKHPSLDKAAFEKLEDFIENTDRWDLLSQSLDGFMQQLACKDISAQVTPSDKKLIKLTNDQTSYVPNLGAIPAPFEGWPTSVFQAYRSGQFVIQRLMVVDRFGQAVDIVNKGIASHDPIKAPDMKPTKYAIYEETDRLIEVKPRLLQPARLNFDFVSNTNDHQVIDLHADINPICAWILPNHLDKALNCYDNNGIALGEMRTITNIKGEKKVHWESVPNSPHKTPWNMLSDPQLVHLVQFLSFLLQQKGPQAFDNLLQVMDETLWAVDSLGARDDQNLSVLMGRPLALVRARLQFELEGPPISDPSWRYVFQPKAPEFTNYTFPVRLGELILRNDGLIGYFSEEDYNQFNTVHMPEKGTMKPTNPAYIQQIKPGNFINLDFQSNRSAYVTMLVDPRASVHASTSILPTNKLDLPKRYVDPALANMSVTFHVGPLLSNTQTLKTKKSTSTKLLVPTPTEKHGVWTWLSKQATYKLKNMDQRARFSNIPHKLRTGWLQLSKIKK